MRIAQLIHEYKQLLLVRDTAIQEGEAVGAEMLDIQLDELWEKIMGVKVVW